MNSITRPVPSVFADVALAPLSEARPAMACAFVPKQPVWPGGKQLLASIGEPLHEGLGN